jgi:hypothetical protein
MVYAKAFAVGVVTGVLAPVVVATVVLVTFLITGILYFGGLPDVYVDYSSPISPKPILMQMAVGFAIGFLFSLWRDLVTKHGTR